MEGPEQVFGHIISEVEKYVHGPARDTIVKQLAGQPTADTVSAITYRIVVEAAEKAEGSGADLDLDALLGVATETIDMLIEIIEATGQQINVDEMRKESLLKLVLLHMEQIGDDPEQKQAAMDMLQQMNEAGLVEEGMQFIQKEAGMAGGIAGGQGTAPGPAPSQGGQMPPGGDGGLMQ